VKGDKGCNVKTYPLIHTAPLPKTQ
jgi:hypothetical protein